MSIDDDLAGVDGADWPLCCNEAMVYRWGKDLFECEDCGYKLTGAALEALIDLDRQY